MQSEKGITLVTDESRRRRSLGLSVSRAKFPGSSCFLAFSLFLVSVDTLACVTLYFSAKDQDLSRVLEHRYALRAAAAAARVAFRARPRTITIFLSSLFDKLNPAMCRSHVWLEYREITQRVRSIDEISRVNARTRRLNGKTGRSFGAGYFTL